MKKKTKQIMAWAGIILLALLLTATMVFAIMDFPGSDALFRACVAADIGLPVLLWIYIWLYGKVTNRHTAASLDLFQPGGKEEAPQDTEDRQ